MLRGVKEVILEPSKMDRLGISSFKKNKQCLLIKHGDKAQIVGLSPAYWVCAQEGDLLYISTNRGTFIFRDLKQFGEHYYVGTIKDVIA